MKGSGKRIEIIAYSGYRGEETPRAILLGCKRIGVVGILKQWVEEGSDDRETRRFFQIRGEDGGLYTIYYDEKTMEWFLVRRTGQAG
jgi:hypothetical protein